MSSVMQTCQKNLGLNLCVMPPISHVVTISENGLVRSCKESIKIEESELDLFYFSFYFYFYFQFIFIFSIFRTTRVRVDQSCHYISHLMA